MLTISRHIVYPTCTSAVIQALSADMKSGMKTLIIAFIFSTSLAHALDVAGLNRLCNEQTLSSQGIRQTVFVGEHRELNRNPERADCSLNEAFDRAVQECRASGFANCARSHRRTATTTYTDLCVAEVIGTVARNTSPETLNELVCTRTLDCHRRAIEMSGAEALLPRIETIAESQDCRI